MAWEEGRGKGEEGSSMSFALYHTCAGHLAFFYFTVEAVFGATVHHFCFVLYHGRGISGGVKWIV